MEEERNGVDTPSLSNMLSDSEHEVDDSLTDAIPWTPFGMGSQDLHVASSIRRKVAR